MKNRKKRSIVSLLLSLFMVVSMVTGFTIPAQAADQDIIILYTNDVHCGVDDNIGYAGLSLYKKQMKAKTPYVALVDAGDAVQGAPVGTLSEGSYLVDIMNQVGYDFAVPGNHEFDYGMNRFLELSGKMACGYYSCNFVNLTTGQTVFKPYKIMDFGDTRVAFVGTSTPESFTKSTPANFQDAGGNYIYGFCEDESGQKLYNQIQSSVDSARAEGADYVILVGHLGEKGTTPRWTSDSIINATSGIDACIDGHSHEIVPGKTVKNKAGKDIVITQTGTKLADIGRMTIRTDGSITTELISQVPAEAQQGTYVVKKGDSLSRIAKTQLGSYNRWNEIYQANLSLIRKPDVLKVGMTLTIPGGSTVNAAGKAVDYETDQFIKKIQNQFSETLKAVLSHTDYELTTLDPASGTRAIRSAETNLGDLTADAYRYILGAEIGLSNGGGIRADIKAGNVTYNDTLSVFPYGNMGCVVEATGQQVKDALEMGAKNCPGESGGFLQVSGITYTIDTTVPQSVQVDDKGNFIKVTGAYRVKDIMVNGQPLELNRTYTLASHNYLLKSGGDGMSMFAGCNILKDEAMSDVDLLSSYMRSSLNAGYQNPAGQGRIKILK